MHNAYNNPDVIASASFDAVINVIRPLLSNSLPSEHKNGRYWQIGLHTVYIDARSEQNTSAININGA